MVGVASLIQVSGFKFFELLMVLYTLSIGMEAAFDDNK